MTQFFGFRLSLQNTFNPWHIIKFKFPHVLFIFGDYWKIIIHFNRRLQNKCQNIIKKLRTFSEIR